MRNLLGVVVLALAMATLSACGSVTASRSSFEDIGGRYVLQTFQGHTLPTGHPDGWTITAGNMELKLDGSYVFSETATGGNGHGSKTAAGPYAITPSANGYQIVVDATTTGNVKNGTLTLTSQDGTRAFAMVK